MSVVVLGLGIAVVFGILLGGYLACSRFHSNNRFVRVCGVLLLSGGVASLSVAAFIIVIWPPFGIVNAMIVLAFCLAVVSAMRKKPERGTGKGG